MPLVDTAFVVLLRRLAGRSTTRGNVDHMSHRLVAAGFSEPGAVGLLYARGSARSRRGVLPACLRRIGMAARGRRCGGVLMMALYLARLPCLRRRGLPGAAVGAIRPAPGRSHVPVARGRSAARSRADRDLLLRRLPHQVRRRGAGDVSARLLHVAACDPRLPAGGALCLGPLLADCGIRSGCTTSATVLRGVATGCVLSVLAVTYLYKFERFSRGVFLIDAVLLTAAILATRSSFRIIGRIAARSSPHATRVAIYGAGMRGQLLVREMLANPHSGRNPVAFVDDNPAIRARRIVGVPVRGSLEDARCDDFPAAHRGSRLELAARSPPTPRRGYAEICAAHAVPVRAPAHGYPVSGRRLRVGVDGRAFSSPAGGVRRYVRELYTAIAQHDPDIEVVAIGAPPDAELPAGAPAHGRDSIPDQPGLDAGLDATRRAQAPRSTSITPPPTPLRSGACTRRS